MQIYDHVEGGAAHEWRAGNPVTAQLVACLQASKDAARLMRSLDAEVPLNDLRGLNLLLTPGLSLVDGVDRLNKAMGREDTSNWPTEDQTNLKLYGRNIARRNSGPLRVLRNTQSAHHDADVLGRGKSLPKRSRTPEVAPKLPPRDLLTAIAEALFVLALRMNHDDAFVWTRSPDNERPDIVQVRQARTDGAVTVRLENGTPVELLSVVLVGDPRAAVKTTIDEAVAEYNRVAVAASPSLSKLILRERS